MRDIIARLTDRYVLDNECLHTTEQDIYSELRSLVLQRSFGDSGDNLLTDWKFKDMLWNHFPALYAAFFNCPLEELINRSTEYELKEALAIYLFFFMEVMQDRREKDELALISA